MLPGNAKCSMTSLADTKHIFRERKIYLFMKPPISQLAKTTRGQQTARALRARQDYKVATLGITYSKSQDFALHKPIFLRFRYPDYIPHMAGNNGHKQTNKNNHFLRSQIDLTLSSNFGTYQATKQLTQKILTYYCLKMQKSKRGIMKCQREHDWIGKTEHDIAFKYT